jgi:putative ABC transport system permease protein
VAASIKASVSTAIADRVSAEYIVAPVSFGTPLSPAAVEAAEEAAGDVPTSLAWGVPAAVEGSDQLMFALDTRTGSALWDFQPEGGSVEDLGSDGILVDRHVADDEGWTIGDRVEVAFIAGETRTYTIEATGDTRPFGSDYLIDSTDISTIAPASMSMQLLIGEGASREGIEAALADFPNAEVTSPSELADELNSIVNLLLQVLFGFLGLSVIIAFIGVANTLALSIFERTRELGILRAIALRRSHVRSAVRWEAAIISGLGTALGIAFGAGFGVALSKVLENTGFTRVTVPWGQLALVVVVASAAGALAAALPARRAAKLDILEAIHQL